MVRVSETLNLIFNFELKLHVHPRGGRSKHMLTLLLFASSTRMVALFCGAHGATQGGIYGNRETGAYSVVISGEYDDLDQDYGNVL